MWQLVDADSCEGSTHEKPVRRPDLGDASYVDKLLFSRHLELAPKRVGPTQQRNIRKAFVMPKTDHARCAVRRAKCMSEFIAIYSEDSDISASKVIQCSCPDRTEANHNDIEPGHLFAPHPAGVVVLSTS